MFIVPLRILFIVHMHPNMPHWHTYDHLHSAFEPKHAPLTYLDHFHGAFAPKHSVFLILFLQYIWTQTCPLTYLHHFHGAFAPKHSLRTYFLSFFAVHLNLNMTILRYFCSTFAPKHAHWHTFDLFSGAFAPKHANIVVHLYRMTIQYCNWVLINEISPLDSSVIMQRSAHQFGVGIGHNHLKTPAHTC
jgi:hypothetical protein